MGGADHQPQAIPARRDEAPADELSRCFGVYAACILAFGEGDEPLKVEFEDEDREPVVCGLAPHAASVPRPLQVYEGKTCLQWTVEAVAGAQVPVLAVLTSPALEERVRRAVAGCVVADSVVEVLVRDAGAQDEATYWAHGLELFDVPYGLLKDIRDAASRSFPAYENLLVCSCDQVRVTTAHLHELGSDAARYPEADAVTSWISFFPRMPLVVRRGFLDGLESWAQAAGTLPKGALHLSHLKIHDHSFGEEKLAANPAPAPAIVRFLEAREQEKQDEQKGRDGDMGADEELARADAFGRRCRLDFPLFNKKRHKDSLVYLDNAATTQRCALMLQAMRDYDEESNANIYRGTYALSNESTGLFDDARARVARFIGADGEDAGGLAYTQNTTASINLVAQGWARHNLRAGDTVAVALGSHHSATLPFLTLADEMGVRVEYVPHDARGHIDRAAWSAAMTGKPKLVCIPHIGNVFGLLEPVRELADEAHEAGARVLLDAAQSMARVPIDVRTLGIDWLAFSAHKAYGPMGVGGLWYSGAAGEEMEPAFVGGGTISHVSQDGYRLRLRPIQLEPGTPPVSQAIGMAAAFDYLAQLDMEEVRRHEAALTRYLVDGLHAVDGVFTVGDHDGPDGQMGLVCFTMPGNDSMDIVNFLAKLGIAVRGGGHCALPLHASLGLAGTVRVSMGVYTTKADVDAILEAVRTYRELSSAA